MGIKVTPRRVGGFVDIRGTMRHLNKIMSREGINRKLRERECYEKPSAKKRREKRRLDNQAQEQKL